MEIEYNEIEYVFDDDNNFTDNTYIDENMIIIDREEEDKRVLEYQKTKDKKLLEQIMLARQPTIRYLANKHLTPQIKTLGLGFDDMVSVINCEMIKAINHFKPNKKNFNTLLYYFSVNAIRNLYHKAIGAKRVGNLSLQSLDAEVDFGGKGDKCRLIDIIEDKCLNKYSNIDEIIEELLKELTDEDLTGRWRSNKNNIFTREEAREILFELSQPKQNNNETNYSRVNHFLAIIRKRLKRNGHRYKYLSK